MSFKLGFRVGSKLFSNTTILDDASCLLARGLAKLNWNLTRFKNLALVNRFSDKVFLRLGNFPNITQPIFRFNPMPMVSIATRTLQGRSGLFNLLACANLVLCGSDVCWNKSKSSGLFLSKVPRDASSIINSVKPLYIDASRVLRLHSWEFLILHRLRRLYYKHAPLQQLHSIMLLSMLNHD